EIEKDSFPDPWTKENFEKELQLKFSNFFVCKEDGNVLGYVVFWSMNDEGNIMNIAVKKEYRGKGVGKMLINHIIEFSKTKNIKQIFLEVREKNFIARKLYESFGFKVDKIRKNFYGNENAIVMVKKLKTFFITFLFTLTMSKFIFSGPTSDITEKKYRSYLYFLQGLTYSKQNELEKAQTEFEKTIELDRNAVAAYKELITVYLQLGKIEKAKNLAKKLKEISDDIKTKLFLGGFYVIMEDSTSAINEYNSVLEKEPDNLEAIVALAGIYSNTNPEKAIEYWEKYIKLNPDSSEALYRKSLNLKKIKRIDDAKKTLKQAIELKPDDIIFHITLSEIYEEEQDYKSAAEEIIKCIEYVPNKFSFHIRAGELYYLAKEYDKAKEQFETALKISPDDVTAPFWLALIFEEKKDWKSAINLLEKTISKNPDLFSYIRLSYYYSKTNNINKAIDLLEKARKINPKSTDVNFFLGVAYMETKKYKKAEKCFLRTIDLNSDFPDAYFYLGVIYEQTGKFEKSIPYFKKVIELDPKNSTAMNYLGYSYADRNMNLDEAEELIKEALEIEPDNGAYIDSLGWVYFRKGKYKESKEQLEKAIEKLKDPVIYEHLGDVENALGNKSEAIKYYKNALELDKKNKKLKKKLKSLK
ncbi:MAG: ribosomal protein S18-alanine N-acetyltransferase, partial [Endomicrobiia bacterium]